MANAQKQISETQIEGFKKSKKSGTRNDRIYYTLKAQFPHGLTRHEVVALVQDEYDIASVSPALVELENKGLIEIRGTRLNPKTSIENNVYYYRQDQSEPFKQRVTVTRTMALQEQVRVLEAKLESQASQLAAKEAELSLKITEFEAYKANAQKAVLTLGRQLGIIK